MTVVAKFSHTVNHPLTHSHMKKYFNFIHTKQNILKIFCVLQVFDIFNPFFGFGIKYSFFSYKNFDFSCFASMVIWIFFLLLWSACFLCQFLSVLLSSSSLHHHRHTINAVKWKIVLLFDCVWGECDRWRWILFYILLIPMYCVFWMMTGGFFFLVFGGNTTTMFLVGWLELEIKKSILHFVLSFVLINRLLNIQ